MTVVPILTILFLLLLKHLVVDFFMQGPFEYKNKGTYGHAGGLLHAGSHGYVTWFLLATFCGITPVVAAFYGIAEAVIHYHIDWVKVNITKNLGWSEHQPFNPYAGKAHLKIYSDNYFHALGVDQWLHYMTYWFILLGISYGLV